MNRLKSISFRQLRALESIAYHQGLKPAAVALNLTVPAVHSQLAQLEQSVGVPLFDRGTRGFVLTSEGEVLLRAFITSQNELGRALAHIDSLRTNPWRSFNREILCPQFDWQIQGALSRHSNHPAHRKPPTHHRSA